MKRYHERYVRSILIFLAEVRNSYPSAASLGFWMRNRKRDVSSYISQIVNSVNATSKWKWVHNPLSRWMISQGHRNSYCWRVKSAAWKLFFVCVWSWQYLWRPLDIGIICIYIYRVFLDICIELCIYIYMHYTRTNSGMCGTICMCIYVCTLKIYNHLSPY